jgi:hypothetical protein
MNFRESEYVDTPHGNSSVWRYMAHWKFERLLNESSLFFANANKLSDQYEVSIPSSVLESKRKELKKSGLVGRDLEEELAVFYWGTNPMKDLVLTNCWSVMPHESYALWKIYLGKEKNGVAVKSTISSLIRAIKTGGDPYPEEFFVGKVKYRSHLKQDELARLSVITTKKQFYDFEKELRVFIINYPLSEGGTTPPYDIHAGRSVKIDAAVLIHDVYVSPFADSGYARDVGRLLKVNRLKVGLTKQSEIRDT